MTVAPTLDWDLGVANSVDPRVGQFGDQAGDGSIGDTLDGAEGGIELLPQRVAVDQLHDVVRQLADLAGDELEQRVKRAAPWGR